MTIRTVFRARGRYVVPVRYPGSPELPVRTVPSFLILKHLQTDFS